MIAPLFRIEAIRGCGCTGSGNYYPRGQWMHMFPTLGQCAMNSLPKMLD